MKIRVIGGVYGGRKLDTPNTTRTHPMSERVRNALFNSVGGVVRGAIVLDAFAGSGSVGLEALSRGAQHVTFVERDKVAQKVLKNNIKVIGVESTTSTITSPLASWIDSYNGDGFDLIFADPPYHDPQFSTVSRLFELLKRDGLMVLSHPGRGEEPTKLGVVVVDNRRYGNAFLTFYRRSKQTTRVVDM